MLFRTRVTAWKGIGRESHIIDKAVGTDYVFSSDRVSNLRSIDLGSCRFLYVVSPNNRKTGYDEIYCTSPYTTVKNEYSIEPLSNALTLSVFPNNDVTKTPFTTYINIHDFSYAWSHNPYPQYTWLVYSEKGSKDKRILINMNLTELLALDNTPIDDNDIQWFYYVDLNEIIVLTKRIKVDYDGVNIGVQTWMTKNWDGPYAGSLAYNYDETLVPAYGRLYTWAMVTAADFAPTGWRMPTNADLTVLGATVITSGALKETGFTYWNAPNTGATNSSGMGYRGAGLAVDSGGIIFLFLGTDFNMWTSDSFNTTQAYVLNVEHDMDVFSYNAIMDKNLYLSVRFIKI